MRKSCQIFSFSRTPQTLIPCGSQTIYPLFTPTRIAEDPFFFGHYALRRKIALVSVFDCFAIFEDFLG
jgi:hypothetical protein